MTEVVVDDLEVIDVPEEHGDPTFGAVGLEQCVVEVIEQKAAVGQARQGILEGVQGQLLLERLALRGVAEDKDRGRWLGVADHRRRRHGHREVRTVRPLEPGVVGDDVLSKRHGAQRRVEKEAWRPHRRTRKALTGPTVAPAEHAGAGRVHERDLPGPADGADTLTEAAGDDDEVVPLPLDFGVELGVGEGDGPDRRQRIERGPVGVVERLGPAATRDGQPEPAVGELQRRGQRAAVHHGLLFGQ